MQTVEEPITLIDQLLTEQRSLTAVERFSRLHESNGVPALAKHYRSLLPATPPGPGQQYAFEVDLDKCSGCKGCVTACHSLNGLDEKETWRNVGLLISDFGRNGKASANGNGKPHSAFQQHVTTACHHCVDPGCLNGCPVLAYDKDPVTGIVRHLDDQCIGCQYCVLKCPYEVPQYSHQRGIVRKCDMCTNRLAVGEAPACVQACPNEAIRITLVEQDEVRARFRPASTETLSTSSSLSADGASGGFLAASPDPRITVPTTRYVSKRGASLELMAADEARVARADGHVPLVFLLVLTQLAVGASVAAAISPSSTLAWIAFGAVNVGLGIGGLHLGRPLKAWRAFLGWRTSWFSREVIVFGGYAGFAAMMLAPLFIEPLRPFARVINLAAAATGLMGVFCSAMIYVDTQRELWRAALTFPKFFGTTLMLGLAAALAAGGLTGKTQPLIVGALALVTFAKLGWEMLFVLSPGEDGSPAGKSAQLMLGEFRMRFLLRMLLGVGGGLLLPGALMLTGFPVLGWCALGACVAGELLERGLFFAAMVNRKMPGGFAA